MHRLHWQHRALSPERLQASEDLWVRLRDGVLPSKYHEIVKWGGSKTYPFTAGLVARELFGAQDFRSHYFQEAKTMLEALAQNGFLRRGRNTVKSPASKGGTFTFMHYRLSLKAKRYLANHGSSTCE